jgi:hypothetical protein
VGTGALSEGAGAWEDGTPEDSEPEDAAEDDWLWLDGLLAEDWEGGWLHPAIIERAVSPAKTESKNFFIVI